MTNKFQAYLLHFTPFLPLDCGNQDVGHCNLEEYRANYEFGS
jgi:hypothetical protein